MQFSRLVITSAIATAILAAPLPRPQANKIGAGGSDSLVGFDDATGYDVENLGSSLENIEETSTALTALGVPSTGKKMRRQANKIGAGGSDFLVGFDDATGYDVENLGSSLENIEEGSTALSALGVPSTGKKMRRQANKIGAGGSDFLVGFDDATGYDVENLGASLENIEEGSTAATALGVPSTGKRQLGNVGQGFGTFMDGVDTGLGQGPQNAEGNLGTLVEDEGLTASELVPSKRQLGNVGQGFETFMDGVDTGLGQGPQDSEGNLGTLVEDEGLTGSELVPAKRQLGNVGQGFGTFMDGVDTGLGQGPQDGEGNLGTLIEDEGLTGSSLVPAKLRK